MSSLEELEFPPTENEVVAYDETFEFDAPKYYNFSNMSQLDLVDTEEINRWFKKLHLEHEKPVGNDYCGKENSNFLDSEFTFHETSSAFIDPSSLENYADRFIRDFSSNHLSKPAPKFNLKLEYQLANVTTRKKRNEELLKSEPKFALTRVSAQVCELEIKSRRQKKEEDDVLRLIQKHNQSVHAKPPLESLPSKAPVIKANFKEMMKISRAEQEVMKMLEQHNKFIREQRKTKSIK